MEQLTALITNLTRIMGSDDMRTLISLEKLYNIDINWNKDSNEQPLQEIISYTDTGTGEGIYGQFPDLTSASR